MLDGVKFCQNCGTRLGQSENISPVASIPPPPPPAGEFDFEIAQVKAESNYEIAKFKSEDAERNREEERLKRADVDEFATLHGAGKEVAINRAKFGKATHFDESTHHHINKSTKTVYHGSVDQRTYNATRDQTVIEGNQIIYQGKDVDPKEILERGKKAFNQGDYSNAIDLFEKSLKLEPDAFETTRFLALSYLGGQMLEYLSSTNLKNAEKYLYQCYNQQRNDTLTLILLAALKHDYYIMNSLWDGDPNFADLQSQLEGKSLSVEEKSILNKILLSEEAKMELSIR